MYSEPHSHSNANIITLLYEWEYKNGEAKMDPREIYDREMYERLNMFDSNISNSRFCHSKLRIATMSSKSEKWNE